MFFANFEQVCIANNAILSLFQCTQIHRTGIRYFADLLRSDRVDCRKLVAAEGGGVYRAKVIYDLRGL